MVAPTGATVLIQGESGVGKELIARAIHQRSARSHGPLISLNCGAIPESLLESELFGFEKGAFTGADTARQGKIEMSDKGTLFLDEVGEMNPKTQIELLRVIETKELRRLGGAKLISVDLRVVAATNKKLSDEVAAGKFREDLFYRLNVVPIFVPPLRERREDILLLADRFLQEFAARYQRARKRLSREVGELLMGLPWPGNVRELRNLMERLTVTVSDTVVGTDGSARGVSSHNDLAAHDGNPYRRAAGEGRGNDHPEDAQRGHIAPGKSSSHSRNQPKGSALQTAPLRDRYGAMRRRLRLEIHLALILWPFKAGRPCNNCSADFGPVSTPSVTWSRR